MWVLPDSIYVSSEREEGTGHLQMRFIDLPIIHSDSYLQNTPIIGPQKLAFMPQAYLSKRSRTSMPITRSSRRPKQVRHEPRSSLSPRPQRPRCRRCRLGTHRRNRRSIDGDAGGGSEELLCGLGLLVLLR